MSYDPEVKVLSTQDHILKRASTWIGSTKAVENEVYVLQEGNNGRGVIIKKSIKYPEALIRIFIEIVSNAIDNVWRSTELKIPVKYIRIYIDKKSGETTVENDGRSISIKKYGEVSQDNSKDETTSREKIIHNEVKDLYIPNVIFGTLFSSTNYNDEDDQRLTSGLNGIGAKITNIFSKIFQIDLYDVSTGLRYNQRWEANMKICTPPLVEEMKHPKTVRKGSGRTIIQYFPDFKKFGLTGYTDDIISIYKKIVYDVAMLVSKYKVTVHFNDTLVDVGSLLEYSNLFYGLPKNSKEDESDEESDNDSDAENSSGEVDEEEKKESIEVLQIKTKDCDIVLRPSTTQEFLQVSFINGICTEMGGKHVDLWVEALLRPIVEKINAKFAPKDAIKTKGKESKSTKSTSLVNIGTIKKHFAIFISCYSPNPEFYGGNIKNSIKNVNIEVKVRPSDITKLMKWNFVSKLEEQFKLKDLALINDATKKKNIKLENLDDANFVKKRNKREMEKCILCVTEGLSARSFIVSGCCRNIEGVSSRDYIGIFTIRGKFLNPKDKSAEKITKNKEATELMYALNLKPGIDYTLKENQRDLRYRRLRIYSDADYDAYHINCLLYNFLETINPTVLKIPNFFAIGVTPIVVIRDKHGDIIKKFYEEALSREYIQRNGISNKCISRFKGLASIQKADIKELFGKISLCFSYDDATRDKLQKIFGKRFADYRKRWLTNKKIQPDKEEYKELKDGTLVTNIKAVDYIDYSMIDYSIDSCRRSIPNLMDGMNESKRKILYSAFLKPLTNSIKVSQFSGYVSEMTLYAHGEESLQKTVVNIAQNFVGSNNISFLEPKGSFGCRDNPISGNARYIYTCIDKCTRYLFRKEDDDYIPNRYDEGIKIEKECYFPILPVLLINGNISIGTGFSSTIPMYHPLHLKEWILNWLEGVPLKKRAADRKMSDKESLSDEESDEESSGEENESSDDEGELSGDDEKDNNYPELIPYYRGFKGDIVKDGTKGYKTYGRIEEGEAPGEYFITEIPVGRTFLSILDYSKILDEFTDPPKDGKGQPKLKEYTNHSTDNIIRFRIVENPSLLKIDLSSKEAMYNTMKQLKLMDTISTTNMVMFCSGGAAKETIKKFDSVEEILEVFCKERLTLYVTRREGDINKLKIEILRHKSKIKFIREITIRDEGEKLDVSVEEDELYREMKKRGYYAEPLKEEIEGDEEVSENNSSLRCFSYLLNIRFISATKKRLEQISKELEDLEKKLSELEKKSPEDLWKEELEEFEEVYSRWERETNDTLFSTGIVEKKVRKVSRRSK